MGNKQSSTSGQLPSNLSEYASEAKELSSVYQKLTKPQTSVPIPNFFERLFPNLDYLSCVIQRYFVGDGKKVLLTQQLYVQQSLSIINIKSSNGRIMFYCNLFSEDATKISKDEFLKMLYCNYAINWNFAGVQSSFDSMQNHKTTQAIIKSLFAEQTAISCDDLDRWLYHHIHRMFDFLHLATIKCLVGEFLEGGLLSSLQSKSDVESLLMTGSTLWALSESLPLIYFPSVPSEDAVIFSSKLFCVEKLWKQMYNSKSHGLSMNRFQHHIFAYKGPTVMLLHFNDYLYCIAVSEEWRESTKQWGGPDCMLIQILPEYRVVQAGNNMLFLNTHCKTCQRGVRIGKNEATVMLELNEGLDDVKHFGCSELITAIEVWGCSSPKTFEEQKKAKKWEEKDINRCRDRKLHPDDWMDNPDRELLAMGGVRSGSNSEMSLAG